MRTGFLFVFQHPSSEWANAVIYTISPNLLHRSEAKIRVMGKPGVDTGNKGFNVRKCLFLRSGQNSCNRYGWDCTGVERKSSWDRYFALLEGYGMYTNNCDKVDLVAVTGNFCQEDQSRDF